MAQGEELLAGWHLHLQNPHVEKAADGLVLRVGGEARWQGADRAT